MIDCDRFEHIHDKLAEWINWNADVPLRLIASALTAELENIRDISDILAAHTVPQVWRNLGYSAGLEYPYLCGVIDGRYIIWDRKSGAIVNEFGGNLSHEQMMQKIKEECDLINKVPPHDPYINALHDMEA